MGKLLRARGGCLGVIRRSGVVGCDKSGGAAQRASSPEYPSNPVETRAQRMATRDNIDIAEAKKIVLRRDNANRLLYKKIYNFNFGENLEVFDFAINTNLLSLEHLIDLTVKIIKNVLSS
jgi:cytidylate kinase